MPPSPFFPDQPNYDPETADGVHVGESPVPGLTLQRILRGHTEYIYRTAWSPDGQFLASVSDDNTIRIWNIETGECRTSIQEQYKDARAIVWSPDGQMIATAFGSSIQLRNGVDGYIVKVFEGHTKWINCLSFSPDGKLLLSTSGDGSIRIWEVLTDSKKVISESHNTVTSSIAWSQEGDKVLICCGSDNDARENLLLWDTSTWNHFKLLSSEEPGVEIALFEQILAVVFGESIEIWNIHKVQKIVVLEGHTAQIIGVSFSGDGRLLASKSFDGTFQIWRCDTWETVVRVEETHSSSFPVELSFNPKFSVLASFGESNKVIRVWHLDIDTLLSNKLPIETVHYTTAKLVLVGDAGVGKTGLGYRLAHNEFKEHASTHGQQFWVINELGKTREDGTQCEAVLWDLAGQHVYRSIHSIFLDHVNASLVLFDPSNRQDPLKGTEFWLEQLKGNAQLPPSVLVGARVDRGAPVLSQQELEQFCQRYGISGGYISTSAMTGEGLPELLERLKAQIPWDEMTTTVTTVTFKRIKDYVLALKEQPDRKNVLVSPAELRALLETSLETSEVLETDQVWTFTDAEMMAAVGHLENHGYVCILRSSAGEQSILLKPELLVGLAASIVLQADKHPRELGAINEAELLKGNYAFDELKGLELSEHQLLLDAAVLRFLDHSICFRETLDTDTLLIFPALIKQKRPLQDDTPFSDDISYIVRGRVENIYATLVVLLGYTPSFLRIHHWQNQAQYEMESGQICGFRMIADREGEIELVLYYGDQMPTSGRTAFQTLFEQFLYQREVEVTRFPPVLCENLHRLERAIITKRSREGKTFAFCDECGSKVDLPILQPSSIGTSASSWLQREEAIARLRNTYETHLSNVKGYRRQWASPRCYLSYVPDQESWAKILQHDLRDAGIYLVSDAAQVEPDDYVLVLDTPGYQQAWRQSTAALKDDRSLIQSRLVNKKRLISLVLESETTSAAPHDLRGCKPGDFCNPSHYPVSLFDLVLNLYAIPFDHAGFAPLRETLHRQWEENLSQFALDLTQTMKPPKVFISYARADEPHKDKLLRMLGGLKRRGVIDTWDDRLIEPGEEWYPAIQEAINTCHLALLLVSDDFINSGFIYKEEMPRFLERRQADGMSIISIIVRPCLWSSEPVLKDLQALPRDGKAVITFDEANGDRDQAWTDIAKALEERAKTL